MPSSTSNSDQRLPRGRWGASWILTILLVGAFVATFEKKFRQLGHRPELQDNERLWSLERSKVRSNDRQQWVLLGSSRMQCDVDPAMLSQLRGAEVLQLAVQGSSFLPVLADLAEHEQFSGVVVCEVLPGLLSETALVNDVDRQAEYVRYYRNRSGDALIEARLEAFVGSRFLLDEPQLGPGALLRGITTRQCPEPSHAREFLVNRSIRLDRLAKDAKRQPEISAADKSRIEPAIVNRTVEILRSYVDSIRRHGGKVVFVRFPSSGLIAERERILFPRREEWDVLARDVNAPTLHFEDRPELSRFECPDGSHLNATETAEFTIQLEQQLARLLDAT